METRVQRYSNVAKKTSRRSMVAIASAAAFFTVGGGVYAADGNLNFDPANVSGVISRLQDKLDATADDLNMTTAKLKAEKQNHAKDVANAKAYHDTLEAKKDDLKKATSATTAAETEWNNNYDQN